MTDNYVTAPTLSEWKEQNRTELAKQFAKQFGHQTHEWPDFVEVEYTKAHPLPALPQGLRTEFLVVSYKGEVGKKTWCLRDLNSQITYQLSPATINGWEIQTETAKHTVGPSIIVTLAPMVAMHLATGEFYRGGPPPSRLRNTQKKGR